MGKQIKGKEKKCPDSGGTQTCDSGSGGSSLNYQTTSEITKDGGQILTEIGSIFRLLGAMHALRTSEKLKTSLKKKVLFVWVFTSEGWQPCAHHFSRQSCV